MTITIASLNGIAVDTYESIINGTIEFSLINSQNIYAKILNKSTDLVDMKQDAIHIQRRNCHPFSLPKSRNIIIISSVGLS